MNMQNFKMASVVNYVLREKSKLIYPYLKKLSEGSNIEQ